MHVIMASELTWAAVLVSFVALVVTLRVLLHILLALFVPRLKIRNVSILGLGGIEWRDASGTTLTVDRIGWSCVGSSTSNKGWFILRLIRVKVLVPKKAIIEPPPPPSPAPRHAHPPSHAPSSRTQARPSPKRPPLSPRTSSDEDVRPPRSLGQRISHQAHARIVAPALARAHLIISQLTSLLVLFAIEVDLAIELEDTLHVQCTINVGGEIVQPSQLRRKLHSRNADEDVEPRIGAWIAVSGLRIHESLPVKSTIPNTPTPLPAVEMQSRLVVSASAPFGPTGGLLAIAKSRATQWNAGRATIRASIAFEKLKRVKKCENAGVHVRVHELKRILAKIEDLIHDRKEHLRRQPQPGNEHAPAPLAPQPDAEGFKPSPKRKPTPLFFLRSVDISVPLLVVTAYYHTPLHTLAACPKRSLPHSVAFALTVRDVTGKLRMSGTTDMVKREHAEWLGKGRMLGLGGTFGWEEIEGRVKVDGSAEDILPNSAKAFSICKSSFTTTTTWLPPNLAESFAAHAPEMITYTSPRCFNDETVVVEGSVGEIRGHAMYETLDSALRIFMARPRPQYTRHTRPDRSSDPPEPVRAVPRVIGHVAMAGVELRVQAPSVIMDECEDERDRDHFFRNWTCPELFCLSIPNGGFSFGGEYRDRSVKRSEADRRNARRNTRYLANRKGKATYGADDVAGTMPSEAGRSSTRMSSPTSELEKELGVPAPPPVTIPMRQHHAPAPGAMSTERLDKHPLRYTARAHLTAETLNIYILATDPAQGDRGPDDRDIFLDEKPMLPSSTRRLDIFAAGPLEFTSSQTVKGFVRNDVRLGAVAEFDMSTLIGENNVLIENIGIDLWRPIVMSCLRDFVSSWTSASSTRTTTSPPPGGHAAPKALVQTLPRDQCFYIAIATFDLRVAGSDPKNDENACRGIAVHSGPLVVEYILQPQLRPGAFNFANRASLELSEDIRQEANALATNQGVQALVKVSMNDWSVDPVVDARDSRGHTKKYSMYPGEDEDEHGDVSWELRNRAHISDLTKRRKTIMVHRPDKTVKRIAHVPQISLRARVIEVKDHKDVGPLDEVVVSVKTRVVTFRLELFSIYLCLVAVSALRLLSPQHMPDLRPRAAPSNADDNDRDATSRPSKRAKPLLSFRADVEDFHLFITLPHDVPLFVNLKRPCVQFTKKIGLLVEWDMALLAGDSPTAMGKWDDILRLRVTTLAVRPEPRNDGHQPFVVSLASESARLRIPFRYVFSHIIDNVANLVKATKQLVHQHIKGKMNFILEPEAEDAKKLPKIELCIKMFAIEIQDDPFETRLNIIWRAGYEEQSARIERHGAFQSKLDAIRKAHEERGEPLHDDVDLENGRDYAPVHHHDSAGANRPSGEHSISPRQALLDLQAYNSSHWVKRMRNAVAEQARREEALTRRLYGGKHNSKRPDSTLPIPLLPTSKSVPLARATLHHLNLTISRTSFADDKLPDFLHDVGKGLPRDTKFSLLVPMHVNWRMQEVNFRLRDYPLPLLHIPPVPNAPDHDTSKEVEIPGWEADTDLVIAEELGTDESVRRVPCVIVPAHAAKSKTNLYSIVVPRSAMTTKTYAVPTIRIRSPYATRIGWGNSISPAIQDVAKVLDTITKQSPDPSDRIGFWDKIRLQFHWRIAILFEGEGPVHFHLKGSRDPYSITGFGAGFVKSWHGGVKFLLGHDNPDREFFQITSREYILGVPNLRDYVDNAATGLAQLKDLHDHSDNHTTAHSSDPLTGRYKFGDEAEFVKVCAKLIHGVRWGMGCVVERACTPHECHKPGCQKQTPFHRACRIWDFTPHWEVHTKTDRAIKPNGEVDDSFAGFRSDFIHFSISLTSPSTLELPSHGGSAPHEPKVDDSVLNDTDSFADSDSSREGYNSMHFTPHAISHFTRWWKLFDGTMSLPVRQGKLFPSSQAPSKKFGKHCATIKYRFSLAPLFISHTYRQDASEEWARGETTVLGIKGKIGRFNVDLHQREQEELVTHPDTNVTKNVIHKAFYLAEVDLDDLDLRVISATFREPEKAQMAPPEEEEDDEQLPPLKPQAISDEDLEWIDNDDYNDVVHGFEDPDPQVRLFPFISCPRFTYYRQIDVARWTPEDADDDRHRYEHAGEDGKDPSEPPPKQDSSDDEQRERAYPKSKFGREPSHTCLVGGAKPAIEIQIDAAKARLAELEEEKRNPSPGFDSVGRRELDARIAAITAIITRLHKVHAAELEVKRRDANDTKNKKRAPGYEAKDPVDPPYNMPPSSRREPAEDEGEELSHITSNLYTQWGDWENRYIVHNPSIRISNSSRQILLKYYYSSQTRKAFVYHLSATAIKFIRDLATPSDGSKTRRSTGRRQSSATRRDSTVKGPSVSEASASARRLLDDLLKGHGEDKTRGPGRASAWARNEAQDGQQQHHDDSHGDLELDPESAARLLPDNYTRTRAHLAMFIKPQIALTSDVDDKSTVILTAFRAQVKTFAVMDDDFPDDQINANVLHSTFATLEGLQAFCPQPSARARGAIGLAVPLETLIDLRVEPWGFDRIVPRTWASMRYDKFNKLRLGSRKNASVETVLNQLSPSMSHFRTGTDRIAFKCDKFSVSANPNHFTAIYNVVTDLLLYSDPVHKRRNSKLEALVFTHDFSNLTGAISLVGDLQQRVRALSGLLLQYRIHLDELDEDGRLEMFLVIAEVMRLASELSLVVESISRAQALSGASRSPSSRAGLLFEAKAPELTWHMHDKNDIPFAKFSVNGAEFAWTSKSDSSVSNRLVIKDLKALNSSPEHLFAEIIAKHNGDPDNRLAKIDVFAAVLWNALPPVGGISIVEQFELHLHPIRLQLEHHVGRRILDYVFSQRRKSEEEGGKNGDDDDGDDDEDDADSLDSGIHDRKADRRTLKAKSSKSSLRPPSIAVHGNKSVDSLSMTRGDWTPRSGVGNKDRLTPSGSSSHLNSSSASIVSNGARQLRHATSMDVLSLAAEVAEQGLDAEEMRTRARLNRTFVFVEISPTTLCLTYRSEKADHSRMFDLYNITYKTPSIQYRSKTWSFLDLLNELKKDTMKSIWSQRSALLGQYLSRAHHKLPLTEQRSAMKKSLTSTIKNRFHIRSSSPSASPLSAGKLVTSQRVASSPLSRARTQSPHPLVGSGDEAPEDQDLEAAAEAAAEAEDVRGRGTTFDSLDSVGHAETDAALLPFAPTHPEHFLDDRPIMSEPEGMSTDSSSFGASSGRKDSSILATEPRSMPELGTADRRGSRASTPEHAAHSMPPHATSSPSTAFPIHRPLRASISEESNEHKAHLLLGSSFNS